MTETKAVEMVKLKCVGFVTPVGFMCNPPTEPPRYVEFKPGESVEMSRELADWLMAQDKEKFFVDKSVDRTEKKEAEPQVEDKKPWFGKKK